MTDVVPDKDKIEKMTALVTNLERAISALGAFAAESAKNEPDQKQQAAGATLGTAIGLIAQTYGIALVKETLTRFVTGRESEAFWALQNGLVESETDPQAEERARVPSAPGSSPVPG